MSAKDVDPNRLIAAAAAELGKKKELTPPAWARFVKTGVSRQRPPSQPDWWFIRGASILRKLEGRPFGVSRLRSVYGGRKNRGHKPEHRYPGSGSIVRHLFKQLEAAGYVATEKGKGRVLTKEGRAFLHAAAKQAAKT